MAGLEFMTKACNGIALLQVVTGFLIYDWIEQPKKQEIIKEVLSLLEQKVLDPHSGMWQITAKLCWIGLQPIAWHLLLQL